MEETGTTFENKCEILAELWTDYRNANEFVDFFEYNDLGLPLAFATAKQLVKPNKVARDLIEETFFLFIHGLGLTDDIPFESLDEVLDAGDQGFNE